MFWSTRSLFSCGFVLAVDFCFFVDLCLPWIFVFFVDFWLGLLIMSKKKSFFKMQRVKTCILESTFLPDVLMPIIISYATPRICDIITDADAFPDAYPFLHDVLSLGHQPFALTHLLNSWLVSVPLGVETSAVTQVRDLLSMHPDFSCDPMHLRESMAAVDWQQFRAHMPDILSSRNCRNVSWNKQLDTYCLTCLIGIKCGRRENLQGYRTDYKTFACIIQIITS